MDNNEYKKETDFEDLKYENHVDMDNHSTKIDKCIEDQYILGVKNSLNLHSTPTETGRPNLNRLNGMRFESSKSRFHKISPIMIFMQNFFHFYRFVKSMVEYFFCCFKLGVKGEDDTISVTRQDRVTSNDLNLFFGNSDIETGAIIDPIDLENAPILTDTMFRSACNEASIICMSYARWFLFTDKITKVVEVFAILILPIAYLIDFTKDDYLISIYVVIPLILLKVMCDWSILMEKYANIADEFSKLANRKDENRVDEYESLVNRYRSSWLYSDNIKMKLI